MILFGNESRSGASSCRFFLQIGVAASAMFFSCATQAQVASFDCARAATATERTICATPALGEKDVRMATYYQILQEVRPAVSGMVFREFRGHIRQEQKDWLTQQRNVCRDDAACLEQAYDRRIGALRDTIAKNLGLTYGRMCDGD